MNSHNRLHYRPPAAASSAFPYASGGEQSAMVSAGVASCAPRGSIVPEPTKPVPRRVDTNRAVPHPNEPSLTVTAHGPGVRSSPSNPRTRTNPSRAPIRTNPSRAASKRTQPHRHRPRTRRPAAVLQTLAHERTRAVRQSERTRVLLRSQTNPSLIVTAHGVDVRSSPSNPRTRTNPSRAATKRTRASPSPPTEPTSRTRPHGPWPRTNQAVPHPTNPSLIMARPAPVQRVRAPCRGDGFLRSHGPHERKINGEWLMSDYRRPKIGRSQTRCLEDEPRVGHRT
jgi:hypothetical protein